MVHITRSAAIAPGKAGEAIAFGHKMVKHFKEKHGKDVDLLMPIGGNPNRLAFHSRYESVAGWEEMVSKLFGDSVYMELIAKNSTTFLPGSVNDEIWRTL